MEIVLLLLIPAVVFVLVCYVVWLLVKWFVDTVFSAGTTFYCIAQDKKTLQHYYDYSDRYYDYQLNQWFYKQL